MDATFIDHLPVAVQGKRWSVWCPSEGYQEQEVEIALGNQDYLDLDLLLEGTDFRAKVRVFLPKDGLIADDKRPGLYRMLSLHGEFLTYDYFETANYIVLSGYVELSVSNPDTVSGQVTMTLPDAPPHPMSA